MTTEGSDEKDGLDRENDAALWALLGRQEPPAKASPYFARRVLREVTLAGERRASGWWTRVRSRWLGAVWCSGGLSALGAVALFYVAHPLRSTAPVRMPTEQTASAQATPAETAAADLSTSIATAPQTAVPARDVEVIADLDNILQREESRLWTEDTARF